MRLEKGDQVAGLPAMAARAIVRECRARPASPSDLTRALTDFELNPALAVDALAGAGYLEVEHRDPDGETWWTPTVAGNALAMASFGRPITRATADRLLNEVIQRAQAFNADETRIRYVARLRVFGSYLDPAVDKLGDLDVEIVIGSRDRSSAAALAHADASGRRFNTFVDRLAWPDTEVIRTLKNGSRAINITREDVDLITQKVRTVYAIDGALPAE